MRRLSLLTIVLCLSGGLISAALTSAAQAETAAAVKASFSPDRLGATATFTLGLNFAGEHQRIPAPVRTTVVHLPAGLGINLRGVGVCQPARLRAGDCPAASRIGRGHALMEALAGAIVITEDASLQAFRGPNRSGRPVLEISGQGLTPLIERITFTGVVVPDRAPYGLKILMRIPPVPTLPTEPDASAVSFSLTFGGPGTRKRTVTVPSTCPTGGFPFAADFGFTDGTSNSAATQLACP